MTEAQAKKIFEKYNPASSIVRCPNGKARLRKPLDAYARAAVNLFGIIRRDEFVAIFNNQTGERTTPDEVFILLLPYVLKNRQYGFYKDYIVHYVVLGDFDWVEYLEKEQSNKPRYIPPKEQFLLFESEYYEDNRYWQDLRKFMLNTFGFSKNTTEGFEELKNYCLNNIEIGGFGSILEKYDLVFDSENQISEFIELFMLASNNTRSWENKGHTPEELTKHFASKRPREAVMQPLKKVGPNEPCPCGSGKKYKKCCSKVENSGSAQISLSERKQFYEVWYRLLNFVNKKMKVVDYQFSLEYSNYHDEILLHRISEVLWANPKLISEYLDNADNLREDEIKLLHSWQKSHVKGKFILMKYTPSYAVLMRVTEGKKNKLYGVKGMNTSIAEAMHRRLPVMLETVLLPFGDKIIYDSFMSSHSMEFGEGIREMLEDEYTTAFENYGIITTLEPRA